MTESTALVTYDAKRAAAAAKFTQQTAAPPSGDRLSIKGGLFSLDGEALACPDQMVVVVLNSVYHNTYFAGEYKEGAKDPPTCYAYGNPDDGEEMAPHVSMAKHLDYFQPQWDTCNGCPMNEYGSAAKGEGKACKNRVQLAIMLAGEYSAIPKSRDYHLDLYDGSTKEGADYFANGDSLTLSIPPTSVGEWNKYVQKLSAIGQPPYGVATRIFLERDPKVQVRVRFEMVDPIADESFDALSQRHAALGGEVMREGYSPPNEEARERRNGVKGMVRR